MASARISPRWTVDAPHRAALLGLGFVAMLASLLFSAVVHAAPGNGAASSSSPRVSSQDPALATAWEVLPDLPHRLISWLYETERHTALAQAPPDRDRR